MDANRFDAILRALASSPSRRGAVRLLAGSALGVLVLGAAPSEAKKGGKGKGKGRKKKVTLCHNGATITVSKKAKKKHLKHGDALGPCPTCNDGVKNGNESDVDCGGSCPRCLTDKTCANRNDCGSALCNAGTCRTCVNVGDCGVQADGLTPCFCRDNLREPGTKVCTNQDGRLLPPGSSCAGCAPNEACTPAGTDIYCVVYCGA